MMKFNLKTFKVLFAFVVIIGIILWAVNTVRPHSYEGKDLNFGVGAGTVNLTNSSEQAVPVQLLGSGSRSFNVSSTIEGISGSSTKQGTGSSSTQLFEFELPSGNFEFTVSRGKDVNLVANTSNLLKASVNPVNDDTINLILITTIIVILGSLYYASNATQHIWISLLRSQFLPGKVVSNDDAAQAAAIAESAQGQSLRSFGDNRKK